MHLSDRLGHLTYSTLVHPGDTWEETFDSLKTYAPALKKDVSPDAPFRGLAAVVQRLRDDTCRR